MLLSQCSAVLHILINYFYLKSRVSYHAAFGTRDPGMLITNLPTAFAGSGTVLEGFTSYLMCRTQSILLITEQLHLL